MMDMVNEHRSSTCDSLGTIRRRATMAVCLFRSLRESAAGHLRRTVVRSQTHRFAPPQRCDPRGARPERAVHVPARSLRHPVQQRGDRGQVDDEPSPQRATRRRLAPLCFSPVQTGPS